MSRMPGQCLFVVMNHAPTDAQIHDAEENFGVSCIIYPPEDISLLWANIPPEVPSLAGYLIPLCDWLTQEAKSGDMALVQGDFGATFILVRFCFDHGLTPVYSTTCREAVEEHLPDGSVRLSRRFQHVRFRKYGE